MKKKQTANMIMVVLIAVIILAGLLCVGLIQGKFDKDDGTKAVLTNIRGIINLERDGVILTMKEDTVLRTGDRLTNYPGATACVKAGDTLITLGDQAELKITESKTDGFCATAMAGEFFVNAEQPIRLDFENKSVGLEHCVCHVSVRSGAQSISILGGAVEDTPSGQTINWFGGEKSVSELSIHALNDFMMDQIRSTNVTKALCFTNEDLDALEAQRMAEKQALLNAAKENVSPVTEGTEPEETEPPTTEATEPEETEPPTTEATEPEETEPPTTEATEPEETEPPTTEATEPEETEPPTTEPTEPANACTITILCDTILNNFEMLDPAKAGFVPSDGVILSAVTVEFEEGETVFDVLNRVCEAYEIQLEYSWTPLYDSYYIEGINNLYEFDCGAESGWMYKVNGWFPNYGSSSCTVQNGDAIVWCYTCIGLGLDVGGSNW